MSSQLRTVPTFNFSQGELGEDNFEFPITVSYYSDNIVELEQEGETVVIRVENLQRLTTMIKKYHAEVEAKLKSE